MNQEISRSTCPKLRDAAQHAAMLLCKISSSVMTPTGSLNLGRCRLSTKMQAAPVTVDPLQPYSDCPKATTVTKIVPPRSIKR